MDAHNSHVSRDIPTGTGTWVGWGPEKTQGPRQMPSLPYGSNVPVDILNIGDLPCYLYLYITYEHPTRAYIFLETMITRCMCKLY